LVIGARLPAVEASLVKAAAVGETLMAVGETFLMGRTSMADGEDKEVDSLEEAEAEMKTIVAVVSSLKEETEGGEEGAIRSP